MRPEEEELTEYEARRVESVGVSEGIVEVVLGEVVKALNKKEEEEKMRREREEKRKKEIAALKNIKYLRFVSLKKRKGIGRLKNYKKKTKSVEEKSRFRLEKREGGKLRYKKVSKSTVFKRRSSSSSKSALVKCKFCTAQFAYTRAYFQHVRSVHVAPVRKKKTPQELVISKGDTRRALSRLYPPSSALLLDPKKKYVCAVCKSVCDLYGLFLHMKQVPRS